MHSMLNTFQLTKGWPSLRIGPIQAAPCPSPRCLANWDNLDKSQDRSKSFAARSHRHHQGCALSSAARPPCAQAHGLAPWHQQHDVLPLSTKHDASESMAQIVSPPWKAAWRLPSYSLPEEHQDCTLATKQAYVSVCFLCHCYFKSLNVQLTTNLRSIQFFASKFHLCQTEKAKSSPTTFHQATPFEIIIQPTEWKAEILSLATCLPWINSNTA